MLCVVCNKREAMPDDADHWCGKCYSDWELAEEFKEAGGVTGDYDPSIDWTA